MNNNILPSATLDAPVTLTLESVGGDKVWKFLASARCSASTSTAANTVFQLDNKHLVQNGLLIRKHVSLQGQVSLSLLAVAGIPHFGLSDVKELLLGVCADADETQPVFRPARVQNHYRAEALRIAAEMAALSEPQVLRMLNTMLGLPKDRAVCLHDKTVFHPLLPPPSAPPQTNPGNAA
eukprot:m.200543 g.200543  ORF g.200543 m.200543 type:complete len:180 (+) comp17695_c0_seq2:499-1038(+)